MKVDLLVTGEVFRGGPCKVRVVKSLEMGSRLDNFLYKGISTLEEKGYTVIPGSKKIAKKLRSLKLSEGGVSHKVL